jgi:hypothetical protein
MGPEGVSSAAYIYADWGIRCNTIQPGFIETNMSIGIMDNPIAKKSFEETMNNIILLRRAGKPEEIGYTALFLASDDSAYITGNDILVDGGWFSAVPYLGNERSQHTLDMIKKGRTGLGARQAPRLLNRCRSSRHPSDPR